MACSCLRPHAIKFVPCEHTNLCLACFVKDRQAEESDWLCSLCSKRVESVESIRNDVYGEPLEFKYHKLSLLLYLHNEDLGGFLVRNLDIDKRYAKLLVAGKQFTFNNLKEGLAEARRLKRTPTLVGSRAEQYQRVRAVDDERWYAAQRLAFKKLLNDAWLFIITLIQSILLFFTSIISPPTQDNRIANQADEAE